MVRIPLGERFSGIQQNLVQIQEKAGQPSGGDEGQGLADFFFSVGIASAGVYLEGTGPFAIYQGKGPPEAQRCQGLDGTGGRAAFRNAAIRARVPWESHSPCWQTVAPMQLTECSKAV